MAPQVYPRASEHSHLVSDQILSSVGTQILGLSTERQRWQCIGSGPACLTPWTGLWWDSV